MKKRGQEENVQLRQVDLAAAHHLLCPFSSPFFGVKFRVLCCGTCAIKKLFNIPVPSRVVTKLSLSENN
jgi:hypothetical protein